MKQIAIFLFCIVCTVRGADDSGSRERTFVRALEAFDAAKTPDQFRQTAALFESMLDDGYKNGAVWFNIGNAYMRAGDFGRAINAYRKAKPFRPADPFLDANLRQALAMAPGKLPATPEPWWRNVMFWSDWLSYPAKVTVTLVAWAAGVAFAFIGLLWRFRRAYKVSVVASVIALVLTLDTSITHFEVNRTDRGVVVAETTARKGSGGNYEPAFDQPLKSGAEFKIMERRGEWVFGHFEGVGDGWLPEKDVVN